MSTEGAFRGKVILITGASSGIGEELAEQLARHGALLTLCARRAEVLARLAERIADASGSRPLVTECDVTRDGDLERAVSDSVRQRGKLDIVFANAGFGVAVTLLSPGFIESNIRRVDNRGRLHADAPEPLPPWLVVSRRIAARQILRAVAGRRREAIITGHGRLLVAMERFAPWIMRSVGRRMAARGGGYRSEPV